MDAISVLIIDDNPQNRRLVKKMLEVHGFKIFEASNGLDGVASAIEHKPRIILLDINLPDIDGIEVANTLRNQGNCESCTIIALTANAMIGDRERFIESGCDDYLAKPVSRQELVSMLNKYLEPEQEDNPTDATSPTM
ncbi:MAG: response regulator [Anaerolineae bacterium]|nr:response regulator [Anaerolineae bacterium]MCB9459508.1 response regulator [Anaerolineaceae bacterium]